jgi:vancomycin resistance protein YoaR
MGRSRVSLPYIFVVVLLWAASVCAAWIWYGARDQLPAGFTVGDWSAAGLSLAEFERQLNHKKELLLEQPVNLISQQPEAPMPPFQSTMGQLGLALPVRQITEQLQPLRSGSLFRRAAYRWKLRQQSWPLTASLDAAKLHSALAQGLPGMFEQQPADARRIIGPQDTVSYVPDTSVMRIDEAELQKRVEAAVPSLGAAAWAAAGIHSQRGLPILAAADVLARSDMDGSAPGRALGAGDGTKATRAQSADVKAASPSGSVHTVAPSPTGGVDSTTAVTARSADGVAATPTGSVDSTAEAKGGVDVAAAGNDNPPIVVVLPLVKLEPKLTVRLLQAQGIDRKISEFTTPFMHKGEGRLHNIRSTAASIHDVLLQPDEVFDYATYIAQTEAKFGFQEAPVIVNGKLVPGIGGGICQVSTTLYNAVLRAGLNIVERRNHSLPVSYVPLGQDASFSSGHINFKFRNNTEKHLLIRTSMDDRQLTVKLFGNIPAELTYSIESNTVEKLPVPIKYVVNPTLPVGKQEQISAGQPGYVVETYRYQTKNGVITRKERISRDTYAAQPAVIARNHSDIPNVREQPPKLPQPPLVEDGVKGPMYR